MIDEEENMIVVFRLARMRVPDYCVQSQVGVVSSQNWCLFLQAHFDVLATTVGPCLSLFLCQVGRLLTELQHDPKM